MTADDLKLLNLGCGECFHPAWVNADLIPTRPGVLRVDVRRGLPFPPEEFDAVYHSHVLEHLSRVDGERFLLDCRRVLRRGGIVRVVVPDLEAICRLYLDAVDRARAGDEGAVADHRWMTLELVDQMVRTRRGGELGSYLAHPRPNDEFVRSRVDAALVAGPDPEGQPSRRRLVAGASRRLAGLRRSAGLMGSRAGGRRGAEAFQEGWFRSEGEVHRWMYDEPALAAALASCGFGDIRRVDAFTSSIPRWASYGLDGSDGVVRKPDSLFMEATK